MLPKVLSNGHSLFGAKRSGLKFQSPDVFVPFGATESDLTEILGEYPYKKITAGYYTIRANPFIHPGLSRAGQGQPPNRPAVGRSCPADTNS